MRQPTDVDVEWHVQVRRKRQYDLTLGRDSPSLLAAGAAEDLDLQGAQRHADHVQRAGSD